MFADIPTAEHPLHWGSEWMNTECVAAVKIKIDEGGEKGVYTSHHAMILDELVLRVVLIGTAVAFWKRIGF